ncbi:MAG: alpha-glucan family phosphorylase [Ardenticatenales bacterium]|nr:alpha-glucan family phosphorylase [Ardenticatenales bacterium]
MKLPFAEKVPEKIGRLPELAYNLWWSWTPDARDLFRRLDYPLWRKTQHNPVQMLAEMSQEKLRSAAADPAFFRQYNKVMLQFDAMMSNGDAWFSQTYPEMKGKTIAYFSFEYGIHNSLPIYSGGLGILSGDHAKESSDLGIPLVGIGFMYPQGYFRQRIPSHGWQEAIYEQLDISKAPIMAAKDKDGNDLKVSVRIGDTEVWARFWHIKVGRTKLYLMDTDVDENDPWNRELSARLYSGDGDTRLRQEMLLGIGGVRALRKLGYDPSVWHMNEGHSAFLVLECIRERVKAGATYDEAVAAVRHQSIFTTHTPVPAGHDAFSFHMMEKYFSGYWDELGLSREQFLEIGRHEEPWGTAFNMTVLALKMSGHSNGVSQLHGQVSREMWQKVWNVSSPDEVPISAITNGVHVPTWISPEYDELFRKYLGPNWLQQQDDPALWTRLGEIPDNVLWDTHIKLKQKLLHRMRERARIRWVDGRNDTTQVLTNGTLLDPDALTIGFARRFATYKRATLVFRDLERLRRLMLDVHRPLQFIFAGKAHPADDPGKHLIQAIYNLAKHHQLGGRIAFIEDYDMHMGRYLKAGVDVWLNNPRRPREASGTSGMKAAINGVPNMSILDGWWVEGYNGANGWAIGNNALLDNTEAQDEADANSIYQLLEDEVIPLYYDRDRDDTPRGWVDIMRESIRSVAPQFGMRRMLKEYTEQLYIPALTEE